MKKFSSAVLIIAIIFSLTACNNKKAVSNIDLYNEAIQLFNEEPSVKMTVSSKLTVDSDKSSTTKNMGDVYISHTDNYIASADFDSTINTTSMPFSLYINNDTIYFEIFGGTFKAQAQNTDDNPKIKSILTSFSTDMFFGVNGQSFSATDIYTSKTENRTELSFNIDKTSIDDTFATSLKKLVDASDSANVEFSKIAVVCTIDDSGFPIQIKINVDASTASSTASLESTIDNEKYSGDIVIPEDVDMQDYKDYDLNEIIKVIDMM